MKQLHSLEIEMEEKLSKKDDIISTLKDELTAAKSGDAIQALRTELDTLKISLAIQQGRAEDYRKMLEEAKAEAKAEIDAAFTKGLQSGALVAAQLQRS
jgi:uncharacterized protein YbjQ (UPF0145 family)